MLRVCVNVEYFCILFGCSNETFSVWMGSCLAKRLISSIRTMCEISARSKQLEIKISQKNITSELRKSFVEINGKIPTMSKFIDLKRLNLTDKPKYEWNSEDNEVRNIASYAERRGKH